MRIFVILSMFYRGVLVIDYGNPKIPNDCEKHFLTCPNALERSGDCEYFLDNRCRYLYERVRRLRRPALFRRDRPPFTRREGDLPHYRCLVPEHLKLSWSRHLKYEGNQKTKWIVMVPSTAFPLDLLKRTFIQVDRTLPEKALWQTEDIAKFNELVFELEDPVMCVDHNASFQIKEIDGRQMAQEEFDLRNDRRKYYDLRMITVVVLKDSRQSCVKIHPKYSNPNQQSNVVTHVVGAERAYPTHGRLARAAGSAPPWAAADGALARRGSAWCRSQRVILALSEAVILDDDGERAAALSGPHYCSLFLWERERLVRMTFKHNDQKYVVKVALEYQEEANSWTPLYIELHKKQEHGQERLGDAAHFELGEQQRFARRDTFYSREPALLLGGRELRLSIHRLGIEFDAKESPFNFSVPFRKKKPSSSSATPSHTLGEPQYCTWSSYTTGGFGQDISELGQTPPVSGQTSPAIETTPPKSTPGFGKAPPVSGQAPTGFEKNPPGLGQTPPKSPSGLGDAAPTTSNKERTKSSEENEVEKKRKRYQALGRRAQLVLLPFLVAAFVLALAATALRFAHRLRNWLYGKLIAPVVGKRGGRATPTQAARGEQLSALQRAALAARYARAQAADLVAYAAEGAAVVAAVRALCAARERLLAAPAPPACRR